MEQSNSPVPHEIGLELNFRHGKRFIGVYKYYIKNSSAHNSFTTPKTNEPPERGGKSVILTMKMKNDKK